MKHITRFISAVMVALLFVTSLQMPVVSAGSWADDYFTIETELGYAELKYGEVQELECKLFNDDYEEIKDLSGYKIVWKHEDKRIPNATGTSYVVDTKNAGAAGNYQIEVTKGECTQSEYFYIEIDSELTFVDDWNEEYQKSLGDSVVLDAKATSLKNDITYTWEKADLIEGNFKFDTDNSKPLNTTGSEIKFDKITKEDYGRYRCTISDGINETQKDFSLEPDSTLSISLEGECERLVGIGESVTMEVTADSNYDVTYQWYKGGQPITGATSNRYVIDSMQKDSYGEYICKVKDEYYTFTKDVLLKSFDLSSASQDTYMDDYRKSYTGFIGESLTMQVNDINKAPGVDLTFTWMKNSDYGDSTPELIEGVTTDSYTIPVLEKTSEHNTNEYKVIVTDGIAEQVMYITVSAQRYMYFTMYNDRPFMFEDYKEIYAPLGKERSIYLKSKVQQGYSVRYQWFKADHDYGEEYEEYGEKIEGQTTPKLTLPTIKESDYDKEYYCMAYITTKNGVIRKKSGTFELTPYNYDE